MTTPEQQLANTHQLTSSSQIVTDNVNAILQQKDMSVSQMPSLAAHQEDARQQCHYWLDKVWQVIGGTTAGIIEYANTFQDTYKKLLDVVNNGGPDMKSLITAQTEKLQAHMKAYKLSSDEVIALVKNFTDNFQPVYVKFQQDYATADALLTGDNQKLIELKARKASLQADAKNLQLEMLLPFADFALAAKYKHVKDKISSVSNEISGISDDLTGIQTVHDQLAGLATNSKTALTFSQSVSDGWLSMADNMAEVSSHISDISADEAAILIKIQLGAANKDWQNVLDQAHTLSFYFTNNILPIIHF